MNIYDAAKILGLSGELNPTATKKAFLGACKKYHPDINPAGEQMMKAINEAFDVLRDHTGEIKEEQEQAQYGEELNEALNAIINLQGLIIEVCGAWLWVTGNTQEHKNTLKEAGFFWSKNKKSWYYKPAGFKKRFRGSASMDEIRAKYGSQRAQSGNKKYLA